MGTQSYETQVRFRLANMFYSMLPLPAVSIHLFAQMGQLSWENKENFFFFF